MHTPPHHRRGIATAAPLISRRVLFASHRGTDERTPPPPPARAGVIGSIVVASSNLVRITPPGFATVVVEIMPLPPPDCPGRAQTPLCGGPTPPAAPHLLMVAVIEGVFFRGRRGKVFPPPPNKQLSGTRRAPVD